VQRAQVVLLHRFLSEAAPPGTEAAFTAALSAHARTRHAAVERALDWVIAMCAPAMRARMRLLLCVR
jgi:hypothetical protein